MHGDIYIETYISKNMNISILKEYSSLFYTGKYVDFFNYIGFELKGLSMQQEDYGKKVFLCHVKDFVRTSSGTSGIFSFEQLGSVPDLFSFLEFSKSAL